MRRLGVLGGLILFLGLFLGPTVHSYLEQRSDINELERTIVSQQQEIGTLEQDLADWDDPAFVEQQARERLRFVKPGEIAFTVQDDTGEQATEPVPGMAAVTRDAAEHQPWYGQVWESVRTANDGLPETDVDGRP